MTPDPSASQFPEALLALPDGEEKIRGLLKFLDGARSRVTPEKREELAEQLLALAEQAKHISGQARAIMHIANSWSDRANYNRAIHLHLRAKELLETTDDARMQASVHNDLATVFFRMKRETEAREHLTQAIEISSSTGNAAMAATFSLNLAVTSISAVKGREMEDKERKRIEDLLRYAQTTFGGLLIEEPKNSQYALYLAGALQTLGLLHTDDLEVSLGHHRKALDIIDRTGLQKRAVTHHLSIAEVLSRLERTDEAKEHFLLAVQQAEAQQDYNWLPEALHRASDFYEAQGDHREALNYQRRLNAANDHIRITNTNDQLEKLQSYFDAERKAKDAEIHHLRFVELEDKNRAIIESITYAKRLQEAVLPPIRILSGQFAQSFILYMPRDIVSGDFYWMADKNGISYFAVGDCTGHGVPGAMLSVMGLNSLGRCVNELGLQRPKDILMQITLDLVIAFEGALETIQDGMDIALCAYDPQKNELTFCGANNPLWLVRDGEIIELPASKRPVGHSMITNRTFEDHTITPRQGDTIYIFSDGYADQQGGERGKKLMRKGFRDLLTAISNEPLNTQHDLLASSFKSWKGTFEQTDDVCIMGVRIN